MITVQLVAEAITRLRGDRNAYRIASHLNYLGYPVDMNRIRDILGETHPDLTIEAKPVQPKGRREMSRNHMKKGEGFHEQRKRAPRRKGGAAS
jgi:hypothetical protein